MGKADTDFSPPTRDHPLLPYMSYVENQFVRTSFVSLESERKKSVAIEQVKCSMELSGFCPLWWILLLPSNIPGKREPFQALWLITVWPACMVTKRVSQDFSAWRGHIT